MIPISSLRRQTSAMYSLSVLTCLDLPVVWPRKIPPLEPRFPLSSGKELLFQRTIETFLSDVYNRI